VGSFAGGHRSRLVQDYIAGLQGWISTAYLPPYAPELNPVELIVRALFAKELVFHAC
jgi:transposase